MSLNKTSQSVSHLWHQRHEPAAFPYQINEDIARAICDLKHLCMSTLKWYMYPYNRHENYINMPATLHEFYAG